MSDKPKRRWYQFSLRTLLVVMTAICLGPGAYVAHEQQLARKQWAAAAAIEKAEGEVHYYAPTRSYPTRLVLGDDKYAKVGVVDCSSTARITDETLAHLRMFPDIDLLWLNEMQVTDSGLASVSPLRNLTRLHLDNTQVTDSGLIHLQGLTNLYWLSLCGTKVSDAGLIHLSRLPKLSWLYLDNTQVTDVGLMHLADLPNLDFVTLRKTGVTDAGVKMLKRKLPNIRINADP